MSKSDVFAPVHETSSASDELASWNKVVFYLSGYDSANKKSFVEYGHTARIVPLVDHYADESGKIFSSFMSLPVNKFTIDGKDFKNLYTKIENEKKAAEAAGEDVSKGYDPLRQTISWIGTWDETGKPVGDRWGIFNTLKENENLHEHLKGKFGKKFDVYRNLIIPAYVEIWQGDKLVERIGQRFVVIDKGSVIKSILDTWTASGRENLKHRVIAVSRNKGAGVNTWVTAFLSSTFSDFYTEEIRQNEIEQLESELETTKKGTKTWDALNAQLREARERELVSSEAEGYLIDEDGDIDYDQALREINDEEILLSILGNLGITLPQHAGKDIFIRDLAYFTDDWD